MQNYSHAIEQSEELLAKTFEQDEDQEILSAAKELKSELEVIIKLFPQKLISSLSNSKFSVNIIYYYNF